LSFEISHLAIKDTSGIIIPDNITSDPKPDNKQEHLEKMSTHTFGLLNPVLEPGTSSDPEIKNCCNQPLNPLYPSDTDIFRRSQTVDFISPSNPAYPSDPDI
jgi:hypothetical protein